MGFGRQERTEAVFRRRNRRLIKLEASQPGKPRRIAAPVLVRSACKDLIETGETIPGSFGGSRAILPDCKRQWSTSLSPSTRRNQHQSAIREEAAATANLRVAARRGINQTQRKRRLWLSWRLETGSPHARSLAWLFWSCDCLLRPARVDPKHVNAATSVAIMLLQTGKLQAARR